MRAALLAAALALGGCQLLLDIEDPVGDECSPFDIDTCDLTDTCDIDPDDGRLTCRMEGTVPAGGLCFEPDDCAGPLSCSNGVCRTFCPVFGEACEDPAEGFCLINWGNSGQICDSECSVVFGDCTNPDTDCILSTNDSGTPISVCVPEGYYGNLPRGAACDFLEACEPGNACNADGICAELCELGPNCNGGAQCVAAFETLHGVQYGFCP